MATPHFVSIVLPVKDTAPYLVECLTSIQVQTYTRWELIAVNDHSSDNSLEILEQFAREDPRIRVVNNPQSGLLSALRHGYSQAQGALIHRMDSDDKMPVDKLESMYLAWQKQGLGSVITGGTKYFSTDGEVGDGFLRYDEWLCDVARKNRHTVERYRECVIPSNCWLVHRTDFENAGGFESDRFPEDYDLCFRFFSAGLNVVGIDKVLHYWRDRPDRISRNWEVYRDNRFFDLKIDYFLQLDYRPDRKMVLWGAGRNGKDLAKLLVKKQVDFTWICDNPNKIGKEIYDRVLEAIPDREGLKSTQILVAVAAPKEQQAIRAYLMDHQKIEGTDFWLFL